MMKLTYFFFIIRPLRVQSSPGPRASTAEETTPSQPRPVTAAALPSQTTAASASAAVPAGAIQLSDLQTILSGMNGESCNTRLVGWLCFTSNQQRGHLEMAPPFTVPCEGREARFLHRSHRESNPRQSRGSPLHCRCSAPAPQHSGNHRILNSIINDYSIIVFFGIKGHEALDRNQGPGYNTLLLRLIPGDLLSGCPHRQFHTQPGLSDRQTVLSNSYPNACVPSQEAVCSLMMVFVMTRPGHEPATYCMRGGHANH